MPTSEQAGPLMDLSFPEDRPSGLYFSGHIDPHSVSSIGAGPTYTGTKPAQAAKHLAGGLTLHSAINPNMHMMGGGITLLGSLPPSITLGVGGGVTKL